MVRVCLRTLLFLLLIGSHPPLRVTAQEAAAPSYAGKSLSEWMKVLEANVEVDADGPKELCRKASHALGQMGPAAREAVPLLIKTLKSRSVEARETAVDALGRIGPPAKSAVPPLVGDLSRPPDDVDYETLANFRRLAAKALGRIGPDAKEAVPVLVRALQHADLVYRVEAALALWKIARHEAALPALASLLQEQGVEGPYQAAMALGEIGPDAKPMSDALVKTLRHPEPDVRRAAAKVLVAFGPDMLAAVAQTLAADNDTPEAAEYALGELLAQQRDAVFYNRQLDQKQFAAAAGPALREAVPALVKQLGHPRDEVRQDAVRALAQAGVPAALALLAPLAGSHATARTGAAEALVRMEQYLPRESPSSAGVELIKQNLIPTLLNLMQHQDPKVRAAACRVLSEFSFGAQLSQAESALRDALRDADVAVRRYASKALGQLRAPDESATHVPGGVHRLPGETRHRIRSGTPLGLTFQPSLRDYVTGARAPDSQR
jgi:HEAT repeat protein